MNTEQKIIFYENGEDVRDTPGVHLTRGLAGLMEETLQRFQRNEIRTLLVSITNCTGWRVIMPANRHVTVCFIFRRPERYDDHVPQARRRVVHSVFDDKGNVPQIERLLGDN